jgi:hypothetical protein
MLKLYANSETLQPSKKSLISEHYDEIVCPFINEINPQKVFLDPSETMLQALNASSAPPSKRQCARDCKIISSKI